MTSAILSEEHQPHNTRKVDLTNLNGRELEAVIQEAGQLLLERRTLKIEELRTKIAGELAEEGLSVSEVLGLEPAKVRGHRNRPTRKKYQLPDGSLWSGKGRLPLCLREALKGAEGYDEESGNFDTKASRRAALEKFLFNDRP